LGDTLGVFSQKHPVTLVALKKSAQKDSFLVATCLNFFAGVETCRILFESFTRDMDIY
jgi:hypothetical protein